MSGYVGLGSQGRQIPVPPISLERSLGCRVVRMGSFVCDPLWDLCYLTVSCEEVWFFSSMDGRWALALQLVHGVRW